MSILLDNKNLKFKLTTSDNVIENLDIKCIESKIPNFSKQEYGYNVNLNLFRNKIDNIKDDVWKKIRWYINKYDFPVNGSIINRAFYKYWEIINVFDIFDEYDSNKDLILHCAEAPGGFIQGSNIYLNIEKKNKELLIDDDGFTLVKSKKSKLNSSSVYRIYTMSLNKNLEEYKRYNLPSYNKDVINKYVCILNGVDSSGNINNIENVDSIKDNVKGLFYLITCDGGFDEGCNFNNKEQLHYQLILNEIYCSIKLQKNNGHFILKMFDIFTDTSIHLLYLLSLCYKEVYIYKPLTSRPTNSEKYIICKNFNCDELRKKVYLDSIKKISLFFNKSVSEYKYFTIFKEIPDDFINEIFMINTNIVNRQCNFLKDAIDLCDNSFNDNYNREYVNSLDERNELFDNWKKIYKLKI